MAVDLEYVVVLTVSAPSSIRPKQQVPEVSGVRWNYNYHEWAHDGWMEYCVEAELTQAQLDVLARDRFITYDCESGGILRPRAFSKHLTPAMIWYGETWWDMTGVRLTITPYPAGLRQHDSYRFGQYEHHAAWVRHRYARLEVL